jgi:hypothetical protein
MHRHVFLKNFFFEFSHRMIDQVPLSRTGFVTIVHTTAGPLNWLSEIPVRSNLAANYDFKGWTDTMRSMRGTCETLEESD